MFQVGDKIFYPMHGAGIVEAMEEKEFLGEKHLYFVLNMMLKELNIMVPVEKMSALGIRQIVEADVLEHVLAVLDEGEPDLSINAAQRYRANTEKMKSGNIYEGAQVIRDLFLISKGKVLGTGDKIMLDQAQQLLVSEIELVKDLDSQAASVLLKHALYKEEAQVTP
ncbi:putative transcription factor YdeB [Brevibacillus reuszeri]|uniref:CarD family transcriptional regulator n=1 Tax=Brevibacillus reuszeri TaxID=54915 RepID=A0A0K9Z0K4_9BACL|nr:CarD family transcriptional regulator [Brevibacillus reuszeri]KNB73995.1 CarD family transcriptional regulator [Brevibacillus reuszeri]MED1859838.1 CarD family transcriptional regulator [Brevibacillus reuszeri]GED72367.1 putative transcription factor YdeB [Brevibacillus reuszeri]